MVDNGDWGPEGLDDLEQELESLSSIGPDNTTEDLNALDKDLEEYGVWVKVGPETIHDSPDIDFEETEDSELENLEDNVTGELESENFESESLNDLEDEPTVSLEDWENETKSGYESETKERTTEPLDELEESLSESIDWDKKSYSEEEEISIPVDAADSAETDFNQLDNIDEGFDEIELDNASGEDEFGTTTSQSKTPAARTGSEESFEPPEITSSGMQVSGRKSADLTAVRVASESGTNILEQIERELSAIKNELAGLKKELSLIREGGHEPPVDIEVKPVAQENGKGFFDEDDDEVVALTGDELDNILETADIMEEEVKEGESSPDSEPDMEAAASADLSENPAEDLSVATDEAIEFTDESGADELTMQLDEQVSELELPEENLEEESIEIDQEPSLSAGEEDEVLSLELSDLDDVPFTTEEDSAIAKPEVDNTAYDEISLGSDDDKDLQIDFEAGSAAEEPLEIIDEENTEVPEEMNELSVDGEEEITLNHHKEPEPEEVALILPEAESEEEEEISLEFPEDLEDGITEEITEEFKDEDTLESPEQEIALSYVSDTSEEDKTASVGTDFEVEETVQELDELPEEELEIPTVDKVMQGSALEEEILDLNAEELPTEVQDMSSEDLETLEEELETTELDDTEFSDFGSSAGGVSLAEAADNLGDINLDIPDEEGAEAEKTTETMGLEEELEELDLEDHKNLLSDEPEDLTLEIPEEDQEMSEPEEISLDLPDGLEIEEEVPEANLADLSAPESPEDVSLELVEETPGEYDRSEDVTLALEDEEVPLVLDEAEDLSSLETVDEDLEEITLELPDEKSGAEEIEEVELEPVDSGFETQEEPFVDSLQSADLDERPVTPVDKPLATIGKDDKPSREKDLDKLPKDLKEEIKTVLTYMDQLLESLPEDKIEEFAKSEYFETYKKLFEDLGIVN